MGINFSYTDKSFIFITLNGRDTLVFNSEMKKFRIFNLVQPASSLGNNILEQFEFGHTSIIDMSTEANDLTLGLKGYFETSERFKIIPETAGAIKVVLAGIS